MAMHISLTPQTDDAAAWTGRYAAGLLPRFYGRALETVNSPLVTGPLRQGERRAIRQALAHLRAGKVYNMP